MSQVILWTCHVAESYNSWDPTLNLRDNHPLTWR